MANVERTEDFDNSRTKEILDNLNAVRGTGCGAGPAFGLLFLELMGLVQEGKLEREAFVRLMKVGAEACAMAVGTPEAKKEISAILAAMLKDLEDLSGDAP